MFKGLVVVKLIADVFVVVGVFIELCADSAEGDVHCAVVANGVGFCIDVIVSAEDHINAVFIKEGHKLISHLHNFCIVCVCAC